MSRLVKNKHSKRSNQVIEDSVLRITEIRVAFARVIPCETPVGKHFAEFAEYFQVPDNSSHFAKCPAAVHNKELMVFTKNLIAKIWTDQFAIGRWKPVDLIVESPPDNLEIKQRVALDLAEDDFPKFSFSLCGTESYYDILDHAP